MKVAAIIVLILLVIFVVIRSFRQKKLAISFPILAIAGVAVAIIVIQGKFTGTQPEIEVPKYQQIAPTVQDAPFQLITPSRAYYVASSRDDGKYLWLTVYYEYNQKKWQKNIIPLPLDKSLPEYKNLELIKRQVRG